MPGGLNPDFQTIENRPKSDLDKVAAHFQRRSFLVLYNFFMCFFACLPVLL